MKESSISNFGLLIAYLVPGLTALIGVSYFSETVRSWLVSAPADAPTLGGFLYLTIASVAVGLVVSTIRWAVLDTFHHLTRLRQPCWDLSTLQKNLTAFEMLIEIHYRYYQHYGNMLVALAFSYSAWRATSETSFGVIDVGFLFLEVIFFAGSRDTLKKYYRRTADLLIRQPTWAATAPADGEPPQEG